MVERKSTAFFQEKIMKCENWIKAVAVIGAGNAAFDLSTLVGKSP